MSQTRSVAHEPPGAQPHRHTKYVAGILIGIIFSLSIGAIVGFQAGVRFGNSNTAGRPPGWRYILVSGSVNIDSLGTPRAITFDSPTYGEYLSSVISTSGGVGNHYRVYLVWPDPYNVTIYYQDSLNNWQDCSAKPGMFIPGSTQTQNFEC
jgi:hypothetical protein